MKTTTMKTKHLVTVLLACAALLAAGCKPKAIGHTDITASSGGRDIHVVAEGGAWVGPAEDKFTVKLPWHELVIGKEQLLLDKKACGKVPPGAEKFMVEVVGGTLTVTADGTDIFQTPLGK